MLKNISFHIHRMRLYNGIKNIQAFENMVFKSTYRCLIENLGNQNLNNC